MTIVRNNYLTYCQIKDGLNAYDLVCKELKYDYLYLIEDKVYRTLRLLNLSISDIILKKWIKRVEGDLEWNTKDRRYFEKIYNK